MRDVGARGGLSGLSHAWKEVLAADTGFQGAGRQMSLAFQGSWLMRTASPQAQPGTGEGKAGGVSPRNHRKKDTESVPAGDQARSQGWMQGGGCLLPQQHRCPCQRLMQMVCGAACQGLRGWVVQAGSSPPGPAAWAAWTLSQQCAGALSPRRAGQRKPPLQWALLHSGADTLIRVPGSGSPLSGPEAWLGEDGDLYSSSSFSSHWLSNLA